MKWRAITRPVSQGEWITWGSAVIKDREEIDTCEYYAEIHRYNFAREDNIKEMCLWPTFRSWEQSPPIGPRAIAIADALNNSGL